jgi:hypothetical protein
MKKLLLLLLSFTSFVVAGCFNNCFTSCNTSNNCGNSCESHQFVPRSISTDLVYIDSMTYYQRYFKERENWFIYTGTFLYQKSRKDKKMGAAFLTHNKNQITVNQDGTGDVSAAWLGLSNSNVATPFSATFSISPERKVFGYHGNWFFNLDSWWCGLWLDVSTAVINAEHKLDCCETDENGPVFGCPLSAVGDALGSPLLHYDRFYCGLCNNEKRRTSFDDLQVRLGYNYTWCNDAVVALYLTGTAPAGRKPTDTFIFEPLVGTRHYSVGVGLNGHYGLWCNDCGDSLTLMTDINYRYVVKHHECRTFDLCSGGPFSRYLLVAAQSNPEQAIPAVNFFTQKVVVKPRSTIQWWLALNYEHCEWDLEVGYNLFWRQRESIGCIKDFCVPVGIFDINSAIDRRRTSLNNATIATAPGEIPSDAVFTPLLASNLNKESAAAGRVLTNKFYAALSWNGSVCVCIDWMAGFGGSYEFVSDHYRCNALPFWGVFGKGNISF